MVRQKDIYLSSIRAIGNTFDNPRPLHVANCHQGCRFHRADASRKLALRDAILHPEHTQKVPHAQGDTLVFKPCLQGALQQPVGGADLIPNASLQRQLRFGR